MGAAGESKAVLVTGGPGYVAGRMIVGLLRHGYRVRATLRGLEREGCVRMAIAGHDEAGHRLSFIAANLGAMASNEVQDGGYLSSKEEMVD